MLPLTLTALCIVCVFTLWGAQMLVDARDRTRALHVQCDQLRAQLERAQEAERLFVDNMTHELRTPLNAVIGYASMLSDQIARGERPTSPQLESDLRVIESRGRHLLHIINNVLDLSPDRGPKQARPTTRAPTTSLGACLDAIHNEARELAQEHGHQLVWQIDQRACEARVQAHQNEITRMLRELLLNAARFGHRGTIGMRVRREAHHRWIFEIFDEGPGIAPEDHARVLQAFRQLDESYTRRHQGIGIGLALVRRMARRYEGDLRIESEIGRGTEFVLEIELKPCAAAPPRTAPTKQPSLQPSTRLSPSRPSESCVA